MKTRLEQITEWKKMGVWVSICEQFTVTDTWERYYKIVTFVESHKAEYIRKYGRYYLSKLLESKECIDFLGAISALELKDARKCMYWKGEKFSSFHNSIE